MASEEEHTNTTTAPTPAPLPPPLPLYPEMIMTAIEELNDENGSNKSTISKQIESTYGNLPPAHTTLLTHHLNKMKQMGQLVMVKNNYMKPSPNAPARRGRGRPAKPKPALPDGYVPPPPRPRGRPPKSHDPLAPVAPPAPLAPPKTTTASAGVSGRKRGRPPKSTKSAGSAAAVVTPAMAPDGVRRGRGRPPKVKPSVAPPVGA